jgi:uroporphyrinogen decarboxylase
MKDILSHRERIQAIMDGEKPDRFAVSVWRHFYHKEPSTEGLVEAMLDFQKKFDWDFMKINPRAGYHAEDWGSKYEWSTDEFKKTETLEPAVNDIDDWDEIQILPADAPVLADHLKAISMIKKSSDPELPLFMTVFNPLGIARHLVGSKEKLMQHFRKDPSRITQALENITATFEKYVQDIRNAGANGIFYATLEWASSDALTYEQYEVFGRPYDLRILRATGDDGLNILHVCACNNFLKELSDYPVQLVNWEAHDPTNVNLDDSFEFLGNKTVIAGLDQKGWLRHGSPGEIKNEVAKIKRRMESKRFIFGPGCSISPEVPAKNLQAVRDSL